MFSTTRKVLVAMLVMSLALCGCWNGREIETLGFVVAVGIDSDAQDNIMLTVHIAKPFTLQGGGEPVSREKPFWVVTSTGRTTFEAVRNFLRVSPRRLFWAHNTFILMGEQFARGGVMRALDYFDRDGETRRRANIIVVEAATAYELLQVEFELEPMPAEGGRGIMQSASVGLSTIVPVTLNDFLQMLASEGREPVATRAEIVHKQAEIDITGELLRDQIKASAALSGTAVFKEDKLMGWLDETETRGLNWIKNKVKSGILVIQQPGAESRFVGLEIIRAKSRIEVEMVEGVPKMVVSVECVANLGDVQAELDPLDLQVWTELERRMALAIGYEITAAVSKAKQLGSDVFGAGSSLRLTRPREWETLESRWDELFLQIEHEIKVSATVLRTGLAVQGFGKVE